ncbi:MAG: hypothetical protein DRO00_01295 [Thermoproteota archaeon]|nr:MAG: hypothetical protein DRO00_01295 [Candidatus Korarchaeota archaeon]
MPEQEEVSFKREFGWLGSFAMGYADVGADELRKEGNNTRVRVAVARDAAGDIVEEVKEGDYDLVVMLKRKKGKLRRLILKGVSERVASAVRVPVITLLME